MSQDESDETMIKRPSKFQSQQVPVTISMPPRDYQPSKAEKEETTDMPGINLKTLQETFFRPVKKKTKIKF